MLFSSLRSLSSFQLSHPFQKFFRVGLLDRSVSSLRSCVQMFQGQRSVRGSSWCPVPSLALLAACSAWVPNFAQEAEDTIGFQYSGTVADVSQTIINAQSTPHYRIYQILAQRPFADQVDELMMKAKKEILAASGLTLDQWLAAFASVRFDAQLDIDGKPQGRAVITLQNHEAALWQLISTSQGSDPSSDVLTLANGATLRRGHVISILIKMRTRQLKNMRRIGCSLMRDMTPMAI